MKPKRERIGATVRLLVAVALLTGAGQLHAAADYCCVCKGQTAGKTINASSRFAAIGQCTLECTNYTNVSSGKCAEPAPAATPTPAAAPPPAAGGVVLAYRSEDCSGDPLRVTASATRVAQPGVFSFQVESGASASVWEKADYAGRGTAPVGPSLCVSPGFEIQSIQLQ